MYFSSYIFCNLLFYFLYDRKYVRTSSIPSPGERDVKELDSEAGPVLDEPEGERERRKREAMKKGREGKGERRGRRKGMMRRFHILQ